MDTVGKILTLLDKKAALFFEYEKATQDILYCEPDDVEHYITLRGGLANEIDEVTEKIGLACDEMPNSEVVFATASGRINYDKVPPEYQLIFESSQSIRSTMSRIMEAEKQVIVRLEAFRDEAKKKIRQNQNVPKIKKYLTGLMEKQGEGGLTDGKA